MSYKLFKDGNTVTFNCMHGYVAKNKDIEFLQRICNINTDNYDEIFHFDEGVAGCYLLVKNNTFRFIICGSGLPIIGGYEGVLE
jgi:hypothetical protein